jgi:hypothetical protein
MSRPFEFRLGAVLRVHLRKIFLSLIAVRLVINNLYSPTGTPNLATADLFDILEPHTLKIARASRGFQWCLLILLVLRAMS